MSTPTSLDEISNRFGVRVLTSFGGRLNQHWLVEAQGKRFVLRRWSPLYVATIEYELRLLERVAELGWPVAPAIGEPIECQDHTWSLFPFLVGEPPSLDNPSNEQRARGRLLAHFHASLGQLDELGQRGKWRRCEEILNDEVLDSVLAKHEKPFPEAVRILHWHLNRARICIADLAPQDWPTIVVHGDFAPWNLRFHDNQLSGILDFELAHRDHRIADFALSWRGKYDEVIYGYDEISPLSPQEWELLTPLWWSFLLEQACQSLQDGQGVDEWTVTKLLQRSPLMGPDAAEFL